MLITKEAVQEYIDATHPELEIIGGLKQRGISYHDIDLKSKTPLSSRQVDEILDEFLVAFPGVRIDLLYLSTHRNEMTWTNVDPREYKVKGRE